MKRKYVIDLTKQSSQSDEEQQVDGVIDLTQESDDDERERSNALRKQRRIAARNEDMKLQQAFIRERSKSRPHSDIVWNLSNAMELYFTVGGNSTRIALMSLVDILWKCER